MIRTEPGYPSIAGGIHSRCIIIRELSRRSPAKHIQRTFRILLNETIVPLMKRCNIEMLSYAIEGNSIYLIITSFTDGESIAEIIHQIKSQLDVRYSGMMNRAGRFWIQGSSYEIVD